MKALTMARMTLGAGGALLLLATVVVWAQEGEKKEQSGGKALMDSLDEIGVREAFGTSDDPFRSEDTDTGFLLVCEQFTVPPDSGKFIASGKGKSAVVLVLPDANLRLGCEHLEYDLKNEGYDLTGNASVEQSKGDGKMLMKGERIRVTPTGEGESKIERIGSASRRAHLTTKNPTAGTAPAATDAKAEKDAKPKKAGAGDATMPPAQEKPATLDAGPIKPVSVISPAVGPASGVNSHAPDRLDAVVRDWQAAPVVPAG